MSYKALYRKYRPSTFIEVVGQDPIVKTLRNSLVNDNISHAYLFCGPRGTGKTSMARLLAKSLNCEAGIGQECNACDNCLETVAGRHPDVIEIDAASNNGVNEIRNLIESVRYAPIKGRYKIYIIDEVHMMTPNAFNALLKTLEEPPSDVIFVLATTEVHKILPTILSRCQRFDFQRVDDLSIKKCLKRVLEQEGIAADERSLDLIVNLADGGMRDALSLLDQALSYTGGTIEFESLIALFSLVNQQEKITLLEAIFKGDVGKALNKVNTFIERGAAIRILSEDLGQMLKELLVFQNLKNPQLLKIVSEIEAQYLVALSDETRLLKMIDVLLKSESEYRHIHSIRNLFEITILKLININRPTTSTETVFINEEKPVNTPNYIPENGPTEKEKPLPTTEPPINKGPVVSDAEIYQKIKREIFDESKQIHIDSHDLIKVMCGANKDLKNSLVNAWENFKLFYQDPDYHMYARILFNGKANVVAKDIFITELDYDYLVKKINDRDNNLKVSQLVALVFGQPYKVYAMNRSESTALIKIWRDLNLIGKLPRGIESKYNLEEIMKNAK